MARKGARQSARLVARFFVFGLLGTVVGGGGGVSCGGGWGGGDGVSGGGGWAGSGDTLVEGCLEGLGAELHVLVQENLFYLEDTSTMREARGRAGTWPSTRVTCIVRG